MNVFGFTAKTAPAAFIAPVILIAGQVIAIVTNELPSALVASNMLTMVLLITAIGQYKHFNRLIITRISRLVEWAFLNNEKHGHRTPTRAQGVAYIEAAKKDPTVPYTFVDLPGQKSMAHRNRTLLLKHEWYGRKIGTAVPLSEADIDAMSDHRRLMIDQEWEKSLDNLA